MKSSPPPNTKMIMIMVLPVNNFMVMEELKAQHNTRCIKPGIKTRIAGNTYGPLQGIKQHLNKCAVSIHRQIYYIVLCKSLGYSDDIDTLGVN